MKTTKEELHSNAAQLAIVRRWMAKWCRDSDASKAVAELSRALLWADNDGAVALSVAGDLRHLADRHDEASPLASPTYTGSLLRRLAEELEGGGE